MIPDLISCESKRAPFLKFFFHEKYNASYELKNKSIESINTFEGKANVYRYKNCLCQTFWQLASSLDIQILATYIGIILETSLEVLSNIT